MSMWNWFGGGAKKDQTKTAIVSLKAHVEMLHRKEQHLEKQINEQDGIARKFVSTDKKKALTALKRKKHYEGDLQKLQGQIDSVEQQLAAIESASLNYETMKAMSQGAQAMKKIHGNLNIDKVDATMDDIRDQVALGDEIAEAISRPLGSEMLDEDELNEELEALEQEALDSKMSTVGNVPAVSLPGVPAGAVSNHESVEEDEDEEAEELRKLQAEMAL